LIKTEFAGQSN